MTAWYDQAWRAVAESREFAAAFRAYRDLLAGSGVDPYREGIFERVWAARERRRPTTTYGLQFAGRTIEGELHDDALSMEGARAHGLAELADQLLAAEKDKGAYDGFVEFAERYVAASGDADLALNDWQRRFAEQVEAGDVDPVLRAGATVTRQWTADVLRAFDDQKQKDAVRALGASREASACGNCGHPRVAHALQHIGRVRGPCGIGGCGCDAFVL